MVNDAVPDEEYKEGVTFKLAGKDALPATHQKYPVHDTVMSKQECDNNEKNKTRKFTPECYELKHLSHYVQPSTKHLLLQGSTYEDVFGFVNPDGSIVMIVANQTAESQPLKIEIHGKIISICIEPEAFHSIIHYVKNCHKIIHSLKQDKIQIRHLLTQNGHRQYLW